MLLDCKDVTTHKLLVVLHACVFHIFLKTMLATMHLDLDQIFQTFHLIMIKYCVCKKIVYSDLKALYLRFNIPL